MVFFDTNVLFYAASDQDARKRSIAKLVLEEAVRNGDGMVSLQVLREFANVLLKKAGVAETEVRRILDGFSAIPCIGETRETLNRGLEIKKRHGLQFYDALIVAAAEAAGCDTLYSEDLADGAEYGAVHVVNPFKARPHRGRSAT